MNGWKEHKRKRRYIGERKRGGISVPKLPPNIIIKTANHYCSSRCFLTHIIKRYFLFNFAIYPYANIKDLIIICGFGGTPLSLLSLFLFLLLSISLSWNNILFLLLKTITLSFFCHLFGYNQNPIFYFLFNKTTSLLRDGRILIRTS